MFLFDTQLQSNQTPELQSRTGEKTVFKARDNREREK